MALPAYMYGDPERVAIRHEEERQRKDRACGDCIHKVSIEFAGEMIHGCEYKRRTYGRRCELFEIKKSTTGRSA